jgi:hypothetical protein
MSRRRATPDAGQLAFAFDAAPAGADGALQGLDRAVAAAVSRILKADPRSRFEVAGAVSAALGDDVSKAMLDAYSAEARESHNISLSRFLALIAETQRFDVLDGLCQRIGCKVVVGEEILTVELGHIATQMERLRQRRKLLERIAPEIARAQPRSRRAGDKK